MPLQRPSGLIVPDRIAYVREEIYFCAACSSERRARGEQPIGFTREEAGQYERHVVDCAAKHEGELRELSLREQAPGVFGEEGWDTDLEQWMRDNRQAIIDGRLKP